MSALRRNTLCIARKDDEVRAQSIREAPKLMGSAFAQGRYQVQTSLFQSKILGDYRSVSAAQCPLCKAGVRIDALVNSYGISSFL